MSSDFLNQEDISLFLNFIGGQQDESGGYPKEVFCLFDKDSKAPLPGYGVLAASEVELIEELLGLKAKDTEATAHVTLNQTDLSGRKKTNIKAARVLCLDLDKEVEKKWLDELVEEYQPTIAVESSPGRYHVYWKLDPGIPLKHWSKYQLAIAHHFGGDTQLGQITKTIRVPGVRRFTKSGVEFMPRIVYMAELWEESLNEVAVGELFPWIEKEYQAAIKARKKSNAQANKAFNTPGQGALVPEGERNQTLNRYLFNMAAGKDWEGDEEALFLIGLKANNELIKPLDESEVRTIAHSAFEGGMAAREERAARFDETLLGKLGDESGVKVNGNGHHGAVANGLAVPLFPYDYTAENIAFHRFSDLALEDMILQKHGEKLLRVETGALYAFNAQQRIWRPQSDRIKPQLHEFATDCVKDMLRDPMFIQTFGMTKSGEISDSKLEKEKHKYGSNRTRTSAANALIQCTRVELGSMEIFDPNPHFFYTKKGVVDLRDGSIRDAEALDYLVTRSSVTYAPEAECPRWEEFLSQIFAENPEELIPFMQEVFGYSISGSMEERKVFCHLGNGANGKSKLLDALKLICGGYATGVSPDKLVSSKSKFSNQSFERLGLIIEGKHVAVVDDIESSTAWNESFIKTITGKSITARALYAETREIKNSAKMHCGMNKAPAPESENNGILRRLVFIPYDQEFEQNPETDRKIDLLTKEEASGILNWAIRGYQRLMERQNIGEGRITYPECVKATNEEYRQENFKGQVSVEEMFEAPTVPAPEPGAWLKEDSEGSWEPLSDLVDDLNSHLQSIGSKTSVTAESLGGILKRKLKLEQKRIRKPGKKEAVKCYWIKLKFERKNAKSLL